MTSLYCITRRESGEFYIGITERPIARRWSDHKYTALRLNSPVHFHRAIRKYGPDAFDVEILHNFVLREEACEAERQLIAYLNPRYNETSGGDGGATMTGRRHSDATRQKMSMAAKGRVISARQRELVSIRHKGSIKGPRPDEVRAKISESQRARWTIKRERLQSVALLCNN